MKLRSRFLPVAAAAALALAACDATDDVADPGIEDTEVDPDTTDPDATDPADDTDPGATEDTDADATDGTAAGAVELQLADSDLGEHLVDADGRTLYVSSNDEDGVANCLNDCAMIWQPVLVDGEATVADGLDESLVGTTERDDDSGTQVTYDGAPLYYFVSDSEAGDARGHGVNGTWWAVAADGPIEEGGAQSEPGDADVSDDAGEADEGEDA